MGRVPAIYDPDIDLDLPLEVDDEYWTAPDPQQAFQQPPEKPAQVTAFIKLLKLSSIVAYTLQTIYAVNKSQVKGVAGPLWEHQVLAEIDTLLSKWIDDLPPHLQWTNQVHDHPIFFTQSTSLYAIFYHTQILVHHPFILSPKKPTPATPFPSQQICVNAAHSCSHVVDAYKKRSVYFAPWCVVGALSAAIVLLECLWAAGTPYGPASVDVQKTMEDVHKCTDVIGIVERRWPSIGKMRDIIAFLATPVNGSAYPTPDRIKPPPVAGVKRERSVADRPSKGGRQAKPSAARPSTSPRVLPVLPSIRLRTNRGGQDGAAHPSNPHAGVSPTDPRAMGPPGPDYTYPTTPAQWYDSAHPESAGAVQSANGGEHGGGNFAYYPPGPGGQPPPHAQESFMRGDGTQMRGMPMWSGTGGAPGPSNEYQLY